MSCSLSPPLMEYTRFPAPPKLGALFWTGKGRQSDRENRRNPLGHSSNGVLPHYFRPLFMSMTLVGLEFVDVHREPLNPLRWTLLWNYLILCLVSISLLHNICVQIFLFYQGEASSAFYTLFSITKLLGSLMILLIFYLRKMIACRLVANIGHFFPCTPLIALDSCYPRLRSLRRRVCIDTLICWLFLLLFISTNVASNSGEDLKKYFYDYFFGFNIDSIQGTLPLVVLTAETSLYFLATVAPSQFFALYYVLLCRLVTLLFQTFNARIKHSVCKVSEATRTSFWLQEY